MKIREIKGLTFLVLNFIILLFCSIILELILFGYLGLLIRRQCREALQVTRPEGTNPAGLLQLF